MASFAEQLALRSIRAVLGEKEEVVCGCRTEITNPLSSKALEIDLYLPRFKIGIEVQGNHHYTDTRQVARDVIKRQLCREKGICLLELSIFQIAPNHLKNKLSGALKEQGFWIEFAPYGALHKTIELAVAKYKEGILKRFGRGPGCTSPGVHHQRDDKAADPTRARLAAAAFVVFQNKGRRCPGRILEVFNKKILVDSGGARLYVKQRDIVSVI